MTISIARRRLAAALVILSLAQGARAGLFEPDKPRDTAFVWQGLTTHLYYQKLHKPVCLRGPAGTEEKCYDRLGTGSATLTGVWGRWQAFGGVALSTTNRTDEGDLASDSNFRTDGFNYGLAYLLPLGEADLRFAVRNEKQSHESCLPPRVGVRWTEECGKRTARALGATIQAKSFLDRDRAWFIDVEATKWSQYQDRGLAMPDGSASIGIGHVFYNPYFGQLEVFASKARDFGTRDDFWGIGFRLPY
jgi:hypothetical protein